MGYSILNISPTAKATLHITPIARPLGISHPHHPCDAQEQIQIVLFGEGALAMVNDGGYFLESGHVGELNERELVS